MLWDGKTKRQLGTQPDGYDVFGDWVMWYRYTGGVFVWDGVKQTQIAGQSAA
jgi:hypothetical protein